MTSRHFYDVCILRGLIKSKNSKTLQPFLIKEKEGDGEMGERCLRDTKPLLA